MTTEELLLVLALQPLEKREQWYCDLNSFRIPEDWPGDPLSKPADVAHFEKSDYNHAFKALCFTMTEEEMSWAWWRIVLGETREAWTAWRANGCRRP